MTTFLFLRLSLFVEPKMDPLYLQKKINVHAPRDGTAAGRHGGAAREHLIFLRKLYLGLLVGSTVLYSTVQSMEFHGVPWNPWKSMDSILYSIQYCK